MATTLAEYLLNQRVERGMSQNEMAKYLKLAPRTVTRIEKGYMTRFLTLKKIQIGLGTQTIKELIEMNKQQRKGL